MKKIVFLVMTVATLVIANPVQAQEKAKWNEKEAFHEIMSKTFHPAEEGKKNAADADIKAQLVELHTLFHEITEKCEH